MEVYPAIFIVTMGDKAKKTSVVRFCLDGLNAIPLSRTVACEYLLPGLAIRGNLDLEDIVPVASGKPNLEAIPLVGLVQFQLNPLAFSLGGPP